MQVGAHAGHQKAEVAQRKPELVERVVEEMALKPIFTFRLSASGF